MVTGEYLRQKLVEPLKEKQRAEGRAEGLAEGREKGREAERAAWEAWNRRRMDAESKGEPFDEPPPSLRENSSNGTNGS
jgi:flagellar biosynthesis/type III secretory pathway protein FliH